MPGMMDFGGLLGGGGGSPMGGGSPNILSMILKKIGQAMQAASVARAGGTTAGSAASPGGSAMTGALNQFKLGKGIQGSTSSQQGGFDVNQLLDIINFFKGLGQGKG